MSNILKKKKSFKVNDEKISGLIEFIFLVF
jgi:hypothetical protein